MRQAETLTPRQEQEKTEALAKRGRLIQEQWNRRRQALAPGKDPQTRGITEVDRAEARQRTEARKAAQDTYLLKLREEEQARQALVAKEAEIVAKVAEFEAKLREKAGLPRR